MARTYGILSLFLLSASLALPQQTLILNDGDQLHGRFQGGNSSSITFIDEHGNSHRFNLSEVQSLIFTGQQSGPPPGCL